MQRYSEALLNAAPLLAAAACVLTIKAINRPKLARLFSDIPNERSLHATPIPRIGGIGIMAGIALAGAALGWKVPLILIAIALGIVSSIDDHRGLPITLRFASHFAAVIALLVYFELTWHPWAWLGMTIALVWMINLYNFMDGSDGLAAGMAVFGFGAYAVAAAMAGEPGFAATAASIVAAALMFLGFNFPPARAFLGDAGSIPLGFLAGALGLSGYSENIWPAWFPIAVFSPFILDATVTLVRRLLGGERVWQAHRSHNYQKMVRMGMSHRHVALSAYALMLVVAAVAVGALRVTSDMQHLTLGAIALIHVVAFGTIERFWRAAQRTGKFV
jgi:UDP-GlcNAc:undecaprenyl-phosphate/decaprenyl-phosphate GlcNAc-1-phosphate transferase